jgi:hypothetical protein
MQVVLRSFLGVGSDDKFSIGVFKVHSVELCFEALVVSCVACLPGIVLVAFLLRIGFFESVTLLWSINKLNHGFLRQSILRLRFGLLKRLLNLLLITFFGLLSCLLLKLIMLLEIIRNN